MDHKNGHREDNRVENLRWVSRAENNASDVARHLRSVHRNVTRHDNEVIEATRGNEVRYYSSGTIAARAIGVSSPLVYNVLNGRSSSIRARGWSLRWVPLASVTGKEVR